MSSRIFKFDSCIVDFDKVNFIKLEPISGFHQVYMDFGMVHVPAKYGVSSAFEQYKKYYRPEEIKNDLTNDEDIF